VIYPVFGACWARIGAISRLLSYFPNVSLPSPFILSSILALPFHSICRLVLGCFVVALALSPYIFSCRNSSFSSFMITSINILESRSRGNVRPPGFPNCGSCFLALVVERTSFLSPLSFYRKNHSPSRVARDPPLRSLHLWLLYCNIR